MNTWSSSLILPAASSAETTYAVMTFVIEAGSTRWSALASASTWPVAKSASTQLFAASDGGGGVGTLSAPGPGFGAEAGVGRLLGAAFSDAAVVCCAGAAFALESVVCVCAAADFFLCTGWVAA